MVLSIDTSDSKETKLFLKDKSGRKIDQLTAERNYGSQVLLGQIKKIFKRRKIRPKDLTGVEVKAGPGSFTGLRVGVSVANVLGTFLNIPVNGVKGKIVEPVYMEGSPSVS